MALGRSLPLHSSRFPAAARSRRSSIQATRPRGLLPALLALLLCGTAGPAAADPQSPDREALAERGRAMQQRVYADLPTDDPWLRIGQEHLFAQIWTRPGLSVKERRLVSLSVAAALGSTPGFASHLRGALESGDFTEEALWEWLIHFTQYAGYPKAAPVWAEYRRLLAERGSMPLPSRGVEPDVRAPAPAQEP